MSVGDSVFVECESASVCVCIYIYGERERECVCVCERERERERENSLGSLRCDHFINFNIFCFLRRQRAITSPPPRKHLKQKKKFGETLQ